MSKHVETCCFFPFSDVVYDYHFNTVKGEDIHRLVQGDHQIQIVLFFFGPGFADVATLDSAANKALDPLAFSASP